MKKTILRISIGVIGFIIIAAAGLVLWLNPGRGPVEQVDPHANGWAEEVEGTLVLHLAGTPYEMGYQRGYFAKDRVLLTLEVFENLLKLAQDEMGLPRFATHFLLDLTYQLCSHLIPDR